MTDYSDLTAYARGCTYRASVTVTDFETLALTKPATISCAFVNPDGTDVSGNTMTNDSTGVYHYDYLLPAEAVQGVWTVKITASVGSIVKIDEGEFLVT